MTTVPDHIPDWMLIQQKIRAEDLERSRVRCESPGFAETHSPSCLWCAHLAAASA